MIRQVCSVLHLARAHTALVLALVSLPVVANAMDWGTVATISSTMGVSGSRVCIGEASRHDIGCPFYAPSISGAGDLTVSGTVSATRFVGDGSGLTNMSLTPDRIVSGSSAAIINPGGDLTVQGRLDIVTGTFSTIVGHSAGLNATGNGTVGLTALGLGAAQNNQGGSFTALGQSAGQNNLGNLVVGIGLFAARNNSGSQVVAIGDNTGKSNIFNNVTLLGSTILTADKDNQVVLGNGSVVEVSTSGVYVGKGLKTSGIVTASYFEGDGSRLTGLNVQGDRILSGTTNLMTISNTGFISLTQAGTNTGWFDPTRGLVTIGVSSTGTISATNFYAAGNILGSSLISTTQGGSVSATYGYFTNISGTNISGKFTGDGSGLTGVTSDRIVSGTGAAIINPNGNLTVRGGLDIVSGSAVMVGYQAGQFDAAGNIQAFGYLAGQNSAGSVVTALGARAAQNNTGYGAVAVGYNAAQNSHGDFVTVLGTNAAVLNSGSQVVAIGNDAGTSNQSNNVTLLGSGVSKADKDNQVVLGNGSVVEVSTSGVYVGKGLKTSGIVTASYFEGDGSRLANLSSADRIVSGTTSLVAQSGGLISITTSGINTGYFNSNGVLTVPGISATANLTSVTSLYASNRITLGSAAATSLLLNNTIASTTTTLRINDGPDLLNSNYMILGTDATGGLVGYGQGGQFIATGANGTGTARDLILMNFDPSKTIQFATNHTERMRIDSSGKVGIGTTAPIAALEVANGGSISSKGGYITLQRPTGVGAWARGVFMTPDGVTDGNYAIAGVGFLGNGPTTSASDIFMTYGPAPWASTTGIHIIPNGYVGIGTASPIAALDVRGPIEGSYYSSPGDTWLYSYNGAAQGAVRSGINFLGASNTMVFYTNQSERMRISGGGLGIGTTSIAYPFVVSGTGRFVTTADSYPGVYATASGNTYGVYAEASHASGGAVRGIHTTNGSSGVLGLLTTGVYGTGMGSGSWGVQGVSSLYGGVYGQGATYGVYGYATANSSNAVYGQTTGSNGVGVYGYNSSTGAYGGIGYVGYGVYGMSPNTFGIYGTSTNSYGIYGASTNSWGGYFTGPAGGYGGVYAYGAASFGVYGETGGSFGLYGKSNGSGGNGVFGINTVTGASGALGASGYGVFCNAGTCGGVNAWTVSSDARLKDRIENLPNNWGLAAIEKLRPVTYHWRDVKRDRKEGEQIGFIAQEVSPVLPALVMQDKGTSTTITLAGNKTAHVQDPMSIKYDLLAVPLVKAVQELKEMLGSDHAALQSLKTNNESLSDENSSLQRQVNNLGAAVESLQRQVRAINERGATAHGGRP